MKTYEQGGKTRVAVARAGGATGAGGFGVPDGGTPVAANK